MSTTYGGRAGTDVAARPAVEEPAIVDPYAVDPAVVTPVALPGGIATRVCLRCAAFLGGLALVLAGAALWMVSFLLTLPAVTAGLWVWSRHFHWGHRLLMAFRVRGRKVLDRAKARPVPWAALTVTGLALEVGVVWACSRYDVVQVVWAAARH